MLPAPVEATTKARVQEKRGRCTVFNDINTKQHTAGENKHDCIHGIRTKYTNVLLTGGYSGLIFRCAWLVTSCAYTDADTRISRAPQSQILDKRPLS